MDKHTKSEGRRVRALGVSLVLIFISTGCAVTQPPNSSGVSTATINPAVPGPVQGVGIEGQDIIMMTDQMMRDMLGTARLVQATGGKPPRVIVDAEFFQNDSSQPINRNLITDRLRVNLNRASAGRITFVGRQYARMVEHERALKRDGKTDIGTLGLTRAQLGSDYRLGGRIASTDQRSIRTGMVQRYTQISFEMIDLESGEIVWSGLYEFARAAADDAVYR